MRLTFLLIILFSMMHTLVQSQELKCNLSINTQQVQGIDKNVFNTMRNAAYEFMNNRQWTNYNYKLDEKIESSLLITIDRAISSDEFQGSLTMALSRPIFNSTYNSMMLNYVDKQFNFKYFENEPLDFYENTFTSNLTSVLAFYAYIFVGLDFDSFMLNGGTPYYEVAQNIVNSAQTSTFKGWKSFEGQKNRYWLVENLLNQSFGALRKFLYEYHRLGMDKLYDDPIGGREAIFNSLEYLRQVKKVRPNLFLLQLIIDAKRDEIINIFSEGTSKEKGDVVELMKFLDPSHSREYDMIMQRN